MSKDQPLGRTPSAPYTVADISQGTHELIERSYEKRIWLKGVVTNYRSASGNNIYFDVKDSNGKQRRTSDILSVIMRGEAQNRIRAQMKEARLKLCDGLVLCMSGELTYYRPRGALSFDLKEIDPDTSVAKIATEQERVHQLIIADPERYEKNKRLEVSLAPLRIGIVTSEDSAAHHDFITSLKRSHLAFHIEPYYTTVQGADAVRSVCRSIAAAGANPELDVVAVFRGGGERNMLAIFDSEDIVEAVADCRYPVFVGIGHKIDHPNIELVANTVGITPTACAEYIIDHVKRFQRQLYKMEDDLDGVAGNICARERQNLKFLEQESAREALTAVERERRRLDRNLDEVESIFQQRLRSARTFLHNVAEQAEAYHPSLVLDRGYTMTTDAHGILKSLPASGHRIITKTAFGTFESVVVSDKSNDKKGNRHV